MPTGHPAERCPRGVPADYDIGLRAARNRQDVTTRRLCEAFAARTESVAVEYVNLKECRTLFSVANEILRELTGEMKQAYAGLDGVFHAIWKALEAYPEYTILILDEIDHVAQA